jgi:hypothetical protein
MIILLLLLCFFVFTFGTVATSSTLHTLFYFLHNDPCILPDIFDIDIPDYVYTSCDDDNDNYLYHLPVLDESSFVQIERIADVPECSFGHDTCASYCYLYDTCSFSDRISHYTPFDSAGEIMLSSSNNDDTLQLFTHFFESEDHGKIFLNKDFNAFGLSFYKNLLNINLINYNFPFQNTFYPTYDYNNYSFVHGKKNESMGDLVYEKNENLIYKK